MNSEHDQAFYWSHAGQHFEIRDEGDWYAHELLTTEPKTKPTPIANPQSAITSLTNPSSEGEHMKYTEPVDSYHKRLVTQATRRDEHLPTPVSVRCTFCCLPSVVSVRRWQVGCGAAVGLADGAGAARHHYAGLRPCQLSHWRSAAGAYGLWAHQGTRPDVSTL